MSRFTVGQDITPKQSKLGLTYGKFYRVCGHLGSLAFVSNDIGRNHVIHDDFTLTREEYEQAEKEKEVTKEFDISKVDVGWKVKLDDKKCPLQDIFRGVWLDVVEANANQLIVEINGFRTPISRKFPFFLSALPPEHEKDPFAPGKWVVCVRDYYPARVGDIIQVLEVSDALGCFRVRDMMAARGYEVRFKSHFRPATPEEIYNHLDSELARTPLSERTVKQCTQAYEARRLAEKTKEQEMKIMDEKKGDDEKIEIAHVFQIDPDIFTAGQHERMTESNRQTFTVGGQEFYVGQTVWAEKDGRSFSASDEFEVIGPINNAPLSLCVRKPSSSMIYLIGYADVTTEKPKPHEWKFGDWARHPDEGVCFVVSGVDGDGDVMLATRVNWTYRPATELTYISTSEMPK